MIENLSDPGVFSSTQIEVLPFLKGRRYDDVVKGYLHALRPTAVKFNWTKMYTRRWCVVVWTDDGTPEGVITKITQQVEVGLYGGIEDGHALSERSGHHPDL